MRGEQVADRVDPVAVGQLLVEEHDVGPLGATSCRARASVGAMPDGLEVVLQGQHAHQAVGDQLVVVDDEDRIVRPRRTVVGLALHAGSGS